MNGLERLQSPYMLMARNLSTGRCGPAAGRELAGYGAPDSQKGTTLPGYGSHMISTTGLPASQDSACVLPDHGIKSMLLLRSFGAPSWSFGGIFTTTKHGHRKSHHRPGRGLREGLYSQWLHWPTYVFCLCSCTCTHFQQAPAAGIDNEIANFFASQGTAPIVIDDATNARLRWMVHKRVLVRPNF